MASTVDIINKFKAKHTTFNGKVDEKNILVRCETEFSKFVSRSLYETFCGRKPFYLYACQPFEGTTEKESVEFIDSLTQEEKNRLYVTVDELSFS